MKKIVAMPEYKDDCRREYESANLKEIDDKIKMLIQRNMINIKNKIEHVKKGQKAVNGYAGATRMPNLYTRIL